MHRPGIDELNFCDLRLDNPNKGPSKLQSSGTRVPLGAGGVSRISQTVKVLLKYLILGPEIKCVILFSQALKQARFQELEKCAFERFEKMCLFFHWFS